MACASTAPASSAGWWPAAHAAARKTPRNAWAIVGLASGDDALCERTLGVLPRTEDVSRARSRLARHSLLELAPRLRRRATLKVLHLPPPVLAALDKNAAPVRTGISAAAPYGWDELKVGEPWRLDAYIQAEALRRLEASLEATPAAPVTAVLLRGVDGLWPFPPNYQLAPQPLAALDLLDYPDELGRRRTRDVLRSLALVEPTTIVRRSARARALLGPLVGKAFGVASDRSPRPRSTAIRARTRAQLQGTSSASCG